MVVVTCTCILLLCDLGLKQRSTSDIVIESSGPTEMQTEEALDAEAEDMDSEEDDEDDDEEEEEDEEEDMEEDKEEVMVNYLLNSYLSQTP